MLRLLCFPRHRLAQVIHCIGLVDEFSYSSSRGSGAQFCLACKVAKVVASNPAASAVLANRVSPEKLNGTSAEKVRMDAATPVGGESSPKTKPAFEAY